MHLVNAQTATDGIRVKILIYWNRQSKTHNFP